MTEEHRRERREETRLAPSPSLVERVSDVAATEEDDERSSFDRWTKSGWAGNMLRSMGWAEGRGLGKQNQGIKSSNIVQLPLRAHREGIGLSQNRKRKRQKGQPVPVPQTQAKSASQLRLQTSALPRPLSSETVHPLPTSPISPPSSDTDDPVRIQPFWVPPSKEGTSMANPFDESDKIDARVPFVPDQMDPILSTTFDKMYSAETLSENAKQKCTVFGSFPMPDGHYPLPYTLGGAVEDLSLIESFLPLYRPEGYSSPS